MATPDTLSVADPLNYYAQNIINAYHERLGVIPDTIQLPPGFVSVPLQTSQAAPAVAPQVTEPARLPPWIPPPKDKLKVGIIGGGIGGLYAASRLQETRILLNTLGNTTKVDISYEILEASDRLGGRLYTHHFNSSEEYDYYVSASTLKCHRKLLTYALLSQSGCRGNALSQDTHHETCVFSF